MVAFRGLGIWVLGALIGHGTYAEGIAIVTNRNIEEYRIAAGAAAKAMKVPGGEKAAVPLLELDGGAGDPATVQKLRNSQPSVVVSLGAYATKSARRALPNAWIVYAMVLYPEVEGFTSDPKMVGVAALGGEAKLNQITRTFLPPSRFAVLHSVVIEESIPPLLERLRAAGFAAEAFPLSEAPIMESAMDELAAKFSTVLLLPDPITENPDRLRYIITRCAAKKVTVLSLTLGLVNRGALCGSFVKPERAGEEAADLARKMKAGPAPRPGSLVAPESSGAVNGPVSRLYGVAVKGAEEVADR